MRCDGSLAAADTSTCVVAGLTGSLAGAVLQSKWVVSGISALFLVMAAAMWDAQATAAENTAKNRGNTVEALSDEEVARWRKATEPVVAAWTKQVKDGGKLMDLPQVQHQRW